MTCLSLATEPKRLPSQAIARALLRNFMGYLIWIVQNYETTYNLDHITYDFVITG